MTRLLTPGRSIITDRPVVAGVGAPIAIKRTLQVPSGRSRRSGAAGQLASGTARLTYHWLG